MRFLFIHQNFPGQFRHVSVALAERGHRVLGIGDSRLLKGRQPLHADIKRLGYELPEADLAATHPYLRGTSMQVTRGQAVARVCLELRKKGIYPDVVVAHPGWGEGLFLKDIFPDACHIHYCEFFYSAEGADVGFDPADPVTLDQRLMLRVRNATQLIGLDYADAGISPTRWQRSRFPEAHQQRIEVLHEGIDTQRVAPDATARLSVAGRTLTADDEVITYVARNLEPYRGFPVLMQMLPDLLAQRPDATVLIVGGDGVSYGSRPPGGVTWKQQGLDSVKGRVDLSRVHFLGRISYTDYLKVLQISSAHLYLTYPFVLSWSMLEAMAAECMVIGSSTPPVKECLRHEENGFLCDFFDIDAWVNTTVIALENREAMRPLRQQARKTVVENYDLERVCLPRQIEFLRQFK